MTDFQVRMGNKEFAEKNDFENNGLYRVYHVDVISDDGEARFLLCNRRGVFTWVPMNFVVGPEAWVRTRKSWSNGVRKGQDGHIRPN